MKLVWIVQDLHIGGGQRVICELSAVLTRRRHEVEILYPRGRQGFPVPPGISARACGIEVESPIASLLLNFPALLAAVPVCDWVLCSMPLSSLAGLVAGRLRGARVLSYVMNDERAIFDDHSLIQSNFLLGIYHQLADLSHRFPVTIAVNSRWTGTRVKHGRGSDYPVIPHGVDLSLFHPEGARLPRDEEVFAIACVGRRHRWKGLEDLVQALNLLQKEGRYPFHLWVITQDKLDLSAAQFPVRFVRPNNDAEVAGAYRSADLLVHPSWFEGFGLPPLEAMACGTPTVITDSGGVLEFARHGHNCLLVPPRKPADLARAIAALLENADLHERLSLAGLDTARQFTWERAADALEAILTSDSPASGKTPL